MFKRNGAICCLVAVVFLVNSVFGISMSYATGKNSSVEVKPGILTGQVTNMDKDALANVSVKIVNITGKVLFSAITDIDGKYSIQNLTPGKYTLIIGDIQKVVLEVKQEAEISMVNAMLTLNTESYAAGSVGSLSAPIVAAVAGGVVIIAVTAYGISEYDSDTEAISP